MASIGLKGKRILTAKYYGVVLEDDGVRNTITLQVVRLLEVTRNSQDFFNRSFGVPPVEYRWLVCNELVNIHRTDLGDVTICAAMPKYLYKRVLNPKPRTHRRGIAFGPRD